MKLLGVDTARRAATPEERRHTKEETAISNCMRSAIPQQGRSWWRLWLLTLALVGCDARASVPSDPYDPTTMDFTSPPARITTARQTGPFAVGDALSMTAALKPLDPASVKEVRLDTTHKIIEISHTHSAFHVLRGPNDDFGADAVEFQINPGVIEQQVAYAE